MLNNDIRIKTNTSINDGSANKPKIKAEEASLFNIADSTKVTKTANQENSNASQNELSNNSDSVFEKFIQALDLYPVLSESSKKLLLNRNFFNHNIKNDPVLSLIFENFLSNIKLDEKEILNFIKFQHNSYTKFHGDFFNTLRSLLRSNCDNEEFKVILRNFLKSYDCFISIDDSYKSIGSNINNINDNLPQVLKTHFKGLMDKLILNDYKNIDLNLNVLKNEILPFIGRYVSKMNDFGPLRNYVSVLLHNIVRLESGLKENFSSDLENLLDYLKYNLNIDEEKLNHMKLSLINNFETAAKNKNNIADSFLKVISSGIHESNNIVNKGVMEDITESLLFSHDVHIPLMHLFLPLNYNDLLMFSEIWISKNYENSRGKKNQSRETYTFFITIDIQSIGYFEIILKLKNSILSLDIFLPASLKNHEKIIKNDIRKIVDSNKIPLSDISVSECMKRRRFNEIFNNLAERKNGVNVII